VVGAAAGGRPLILHSNGSAWKQVRNSDRLQQLDAVAAVSSTKALAVGSEFLTLH
jgi:hypothetical protein